MSENVKKLYRSKKARVFEGVCGGLAEYFDADPTLVRLIVIVATIFTAVLPALLVYLIAWIIVPEEK